VGVSKTGLYWEFQNKVGLLNAVIDQVVTEWVDQIREAARVGGTPRDRLDVALKMLQARISERPEIFRVLLVVLAERAQIDEEARVALRRFYVSAHAALLEGIQESVGNSLPAEQISVICDLVLAMVNGVFLRAQIYGGEGLERQFAVIRSAIILLVRDLHSTVLGASPATDNVTPLSRPKTT